MLGKTGAKVKAKVRFFQNPYLPVDLPTRVRRGRYCTKPDWSLTRKQVLYLGKRPPLLGTWGRGQEPVWNAARLAAIDAHCSVYSRFFTLLVTNQLG